MLCMSYFCYIFRQTSRFGTLHSRLKQCKHVWIFFKIPPGISGNLLEICSVKFVDTLWNVADVAANWVSVSVFSVCETDDTSNTFVMRVHLTDILKLFISHTVKASWWTYHVMCTDGVATSSYSGLHTRRSHAHLQGRHQTRLQLHNICRHCRNPTTRMSVSSALNFGFLQCWVGVNRCASGIDSDTQQLQSSFSYRSSDLPTVSLHNRHISSTGWN